MAWVEGESIIWEQGIDGACEFEMFANDAQTQPWPFPSWDVNSVLSDESQRNKYTLTTITDPINGIVKVIAPESLLNSLKTTKKYFLNTILVAPGNVVADDHHLAFIPVTIAKRPARRDP